MKRNLENSLHGFLELINKIQVTVNIPEIESDPTIPVKILIKFFSSEQTESVFSSSVTLEKMEEEN